MNFFVSCGPTPFIIERNGIWRMIWDRGRRPIIAIACSIDVIVRKLRVPKYAVLATRSTSDAIDGSMVFARSAAELIGSLITLMTSAITAGKVGRTSIFLSTFKISLRSIAVRHIIGRPLRNLNCERIFS